MKYVSILCLILFSNPSIAGSGGGEIRQIMVHASGGNGSGVILFKTQTNTNKAACSTNDGGTQWAFSLESEHGRAMYSLLLYARAQQKSINVAGANDCSAWGDRERPRYIYINN